MKLRYMVEQNKNKAYEKGLDNHKDAKNNHLDDDDDENDIVVCRNRKLRLDELDIELIDLLFSGTSSRKCAEILKKPVSTIQRRVRQLIQNGYLRPMFGLGYSELRLKRGFLHVYLKDGSTQNVMAKLLPRIGIHSVGIHLGNSDLVAHFVYHDSRDVLELIGWTKHLEGVSKVLWSEEVSSESTSPKLAGMFTNLA